MFPRKGQRQEEAQGIREEMSPHVQKCLSFLKLHGLTLATFGGVLLGVILGVLLRLRPDPWTPREAMYVKFIGSLFLQMLKGIIIPLVIPSLIVAVGNLNLNLSGKIGGRAVTYYITTTILAVVLGIILVTTIRPGVGTNNSDEVSINQKKNVTTQDTLMDLVRNLFPDNIIQACLEKVQTVVIYPGHTNPDSPIREDDKDTWKFEETLSPGSNILGLIVSALVFGVAIAVVGKEGEPVLIFFQSVTAITMRVTQWIITLAPVGVLFLVAGQMLEMKDMEQTFKSLGWYFMTVLVGLLIHGGIVLPLIYVICTRRLPFKFIGNMANVIATAFGTASSSATLPVNIETLERKSGIDPRVTRFVLPIGATINMDGTALYEAVAAIFIAQVRGRELSAGNIFAISITATMASIGAAGIPQAGLVTMVMVLETVGLPSSDVGLILAVDWLLDRFRTAINVLGDAIGAAIVYHFSKQELEQLDRNKVEDPDANSKVTGESCSTVEMDHVNSSETLEHTKI